MEQWAFMLELD